MDEDRAQALPLPGTPDYLQLFEAAADGFLLCDVATGAIVEANPAACRMHGFSPGELRQVPVAQLIEPGAQEEFAERSRGLQSGHTLELVLRHVRRDGSAFQAEWRGTLITFGGSDCLLGIIRDVTGRTEGEHALLEHVAERTREQAALLELSHSLASTLEFQPGWILDKLHKVIEYTQAGFFGVEGDALVLLATRGTPQVEISSPRHIHAQATETLSAIFEAHRPVCIPDVWEDSRPARLLRSLLKDRADLLLEGMASWMWVPLTVKSHLVGAIGLAHEQDDFFSGHHSAVALSVAGQVAITLVNADLYRKARTVAALQERQRLAQNLHDAVNQSLFSAGLIAEVLPRIWDQDHAVTRQSLEELSRLIRGAMAEMRALLAELRPSTLTDAELGDLLHMLANAFTGRTGTPVDLRITGEGRLPADVQIAVYHICQEALTNITKHADAHRVDISLCQEDDEIDLLVQDDGRGFLPDKKYSGHLGLGMMRERAETANVLLQITSQPGCGSQVRIHWPREAS
ncbi:MAG: histidine kinase [Anaerolineae bacterium]